MNLPDNINSRINKFIQISILALLFSMVLYYPAFAQSKEEMKLLQMYFIADELVVSATRTLKPLSQVAENISIVTAEEIEAMNVHSVAEVLSRVTGFFVDFRGNDFMSDSATLIQGMLIERRVFLLVDGVPWSDISGGDIQTNVIPVGIIKRIEIVKGPASSSWGSSLDGVVNIVTKDTGDSTAPSGSVTASLGEWNTQDHSAEVSGRAGIAGYYIHANRQESDGLRENRFMDRNSVYAKLRIDAAPDIDLTFSTGYSDINSNPGDLLSSDLTTVLTTRKFFATASIKAELTDNLYIDASVYNVKQNFFQDNNELSTGDLYLDNDNEEESIGGSVKINWKNDSHNAVLGIDYSDTNYEQTLTSGSYLQSLGSPAEAKSDPGIEKWAVYINDTITVGNFAVTPGIRFDNNNTDGDFTSPSIGVTYMLGKSTILRAYAAKGFSTPPLILIEGGALFLDPNPDLKPEKVLSYQAGIESWAFDYFRGKLTFFHHDMKDVMVRELFAAGAPLFNDLFFNKAEIKRDGVEAEIETAPIHDISFKTGFAYVHTRKYLDEATSEDIYAYNAAVTYDDNGSFRAFLDGRYVWWDLPSSSAAEYDAFIVDLTLAKIISSFEQFTPEIFLSVHNIFNSSYYALGDRKNPGRWIEAGLKLKF